MLLFIAFFCDAISKWVINQAANYTNVLCDITKRMSEKEVKILVLPQDHTGLPNGSYQLMQNDCYKQNKIER